MASKDHAVSLLNATNAQRDLAMKLSSLKQAKDILLSVDPSLASELFRYLVELQFSPEAPVRKMLIQIIEEIAMKAMEHCSVLISVLLTFLRDIDLIVVKQSIASGTHLFCNVLQKMALQFQHHGKVEPWLEEIWLWMLKFKDDVFAIAVEHGSLGKRLLALKFLETYILLFTADNNDFVMEGKRQLFNISWLPDGHPSFEPVALLSDANRTLGTLLDFLRLPRRLSGSLIITVISCVAAVGRKRLQHYKTVISVLLEFASKLEMMHGCQVSCILYSLKSAFLTFLRCAHPYVLESRDALVRALRVLNAGDAADQLIKQVDKIIKNNERAFREVRISRDDQPVSQLPVSVDRSRKRAAHLDDELLTNGREVVSKRTHYGHVIPSTMPIQISDFEKESVLANEISRTSSLFCNDLSPAEKMITMIGALLAEGDRGSESLEVLISNMHPDLLADIVITNMKFLPNSPLLTKSVNLPLNHQISSHIFSHTETSSVPASPLSTAPFTGKIAPIVMESSSLISETVTISHLPADSKRDPRRDPRRLDPRCTSVEAPSVSTVCNISAVMAPDVSSRMPGSPLHVSSFKDSQRSSTSKSISVSEIGQESLKEEVLSLVGIIPSPEVDISLDQTLPQYHLDGCFIPEELSEVGVAQGAETFALMESYRQPYEVKMPKLEDKHQDLSCLQRYIKPTEEQRRHMGKLAVEQIIDSYKHLSLVDCNEIRMDLLAQLVVQIDADDCIDVLQRHVLVNYRRQKGHELVMHILVHLHSLMFQYSDEDSSQAAIIYEKFLLVAAKSLLDSFPASDKSFSRLLGEVPFLPESVLKLLDDLCYSDVFDPHGNEVRDIERVTQGLGAVWSLIMGRPNDRKACLDIALKCAVHLQDEIRAKAIRLVANKLYQLDYISESIEKFARDMLFSGIDQGPDTKFSQTEAANQVHRVISGIGTSENVLIMGEQSVTQSTSTMSCFEAQRLSSLFFALCTKRYSHLQLVFAVYGRASKTLKQAIHRHMPTVIRTLGSSYSQLLYILSDPPDGCENLLILVLQILTEERIPADLMATVKHLYETKLKDATILIPILSSLSKDEVLPILPQLVSLPTEKFQMALAHILQGSTCMGPALTPTEVLVAIHGIVPERDGLPLKKITDACSACFEQRTVFTQQVLAKALNQMVDETPPPLLFMRTVIQAIDAFPSLVDFVMEILCKLVSKQVWKMPKLWVGFLKCVAQTRPHSFSVLLQLPAQQLESALNKHTNLRSSLVAYTSQPSIKTSVNRSLLTVLGLEGE